MRRFISLRSETATRQKAIGSSGRLLLIPIIVLSLGGCAGKIRGILEPVAYTAPGTSQVEMVVATTRMRTVPAEMFSGLRAPSAAFADITVSIPPDGVRQIGEVQWPQQIPGNPATDFVTLKADILDRPQALSAFHRLVQKVPKRQALVFVHGFNNRFEDAVVRFAQIVHDSGADVAPVLFTWPSKGSALAYGYDRESANYSRDTLEAVLRALAKDPEVGQVSVLAHSMGNWVTLEALRQMAIRDGKVADKIRTVLLAAPDVDVDVARQEIATLGPKRPNFILFVSEDDRALAISRKLWGGARLGAINPDIEPYKSELESEKIEVVNLTSEISPDRFHHGKFAENPMAVQLIGRSLASGQILTDSRVGVGERIMATTAGAAASVGHAAGLVVSAPLTIVDPTTRENFGDQIDAFGRSVENAAAPP
ncbi:esterase [Beijerinckiaceae bacterium]|nr:esterase [Beijerinckiaceae bacterium]